MMGGQSSKTRGSDTPSLPLQANTNSQLREDLSSYEDACNRDPELQSFDAALHERTNHVINSLATGVGILSLGSFKEVTNCLLEMNQDVVKVILESKEDIWNNRELFGLVEEYFENSVKTMEFCAALESSLKRAQNSQLIIQFAIKQFEEEVEMQDGAVEKKFVKTLEGLQKFKAAGAGPPPPHPSSDFSLLLASLELGSLDCTQASPSQSLRLSLSSRLNFSPISSHHRPSFSPPAPDLPSLATQTETGHSPLPSGFFFFQQRRPLPVKQHRLPPADPVAPPNSLHSSSLLPQLQPSSSSKNHEQQQRRKTTSSPVLTSEPAAHTRQRRGNTFVISFNRSAAALLQQRHPQTHDFPLQLQKTISSLNSDGQKPTHLQQAPSAVPTDRPPAAAVDLLHRRSPASSTPCCQYMEQGRRG